MTDRQQALLVRVAAQLELRRAEAALKRYMVAEGQLSTATVHKAFAGQNIKLTTLVTLVDALDCDVVIELVKHPA